MVLRNLYSVGKAIVWKLKSSFEELMLWFTFLPVPNINDFVFAGLILNYKFIFSKVIRDVDEVEI